MGHVFSFSRTLLLPALSLRRSLDFPLLWPACGLPRYNVRCLWICEEYEVQIGSLQNQGNGESAVTMPGATSTVSPAALSHAQRLCFRLMCRRRLYILLPTCRVCPTHKNPHICNSASIGAHGTTSAGFTMPSAVPRSLLSLKDRHA